MDWLNLAATWLREFLAHQPWLGPLRPSIDRLPAWALLASGAAFLTGLLFLVFWIRPRRRVRAPNRIQSRAASASLRSSASVASAISIGRLTQPASDNDTRSVRVFVSSTFKDMEAERNVLVKEVFPELRARLRARGVEVFEVDLRWGISEEQSQRGETLPTLLAEIDRCQPYFVGLLGERYGWIPEAGKLTDDLKAAFPSIVGAAGKSVTEMEIIHGVLARPGAAASAIFFERDPAWSKAQGEDFIEVSRDAQVKLSDLKARIVASGVQIVRYATPHDIGSAVRDALCQALEARFPETDKYDQFSQTQRLHAAYARERRGLHIGAKSYVARLDHWMGEVNAPPILITGDSGGGKSTLIANWLHAWRTTHPDDIVFEHYLGASPDSADPITIMQRLWEHLNRITGDTVNLPTGETEFMDMAAGLARRIAQAAPQIRNGAVVIALDGLDKLSREQNLRWLPRVLPSNVKLIASSLDAEAKTAALELGWSTLEIVPLDDAERRAFVEQTLSGWGRQLSAHHVASILAHEFASNPLFLKTVLEELRYSATHSALAKRLSFYLAARDLPDLFTRMLQRLEEDSGDTAFVTHAMSLVWASRAGLEEAEIVAMTGTSPLDWAKLRNGLGDALRDQVGRITFSHEFLRYAVEARYLSTDGQKRAAHATIADKFYEREPDARYAEELPHQLRAAEDWARLETLLLNLDRFTLLRIRGDREVLSYWLSLKERGRDPEGLLCGAFVQRAGEAEYWTRTDVDFAFSLGSFLDFAGTVGKPTQDLGENRTRACGRLLGVDHQHTLISAHNLAETLSAAGELARAQSLEEQVLESRSRTLGLGHSDTLFSKSGLAEILRKRGNLERAQVLHEEVLDERARTLGPEHSDTLASQSYLAGTLYQRGKLSAAEDLQRRVLDARKRVLGSDHPHTLTAAANLALTLDALGDFTEAEALHRNVLDAETRILGSEHPTTLVTANNHGLSLYERGDLAEALIVFRNVSDTQTRVLGLKHPDTLTTMSNLVMTMRLSNQIDEAKSIAVRLVENSTNALGPEHPITLAALNHLALILSDCGDVSGSRDILRRIVVGRSKVSGEEHPATLAATANLAATLYELGALDEAQEMFERVVELQSRLLGPEHPQTLTNMAWIAQIFADRGNVAGARTIQERVLEGRTHALGPDHPDTIKVLRNLGDSMSECDDAEGLQAVQERLLSSQMRVLGVDHPDTLATMQSLASNLHAQGEVGRARELFEQVVQAQTRQFGKDHPDTLMSGATLAIADGDLLAARTLLEAVVATRTSTSGVDHPATMDAIDALSELKAALDLGART